MDDNLRDDRLDGAEEIAEFIGVSVRRAYYLLSTKQIPAGKEGEIWTGSRRRLREHYDKLTNGELG